MASEYSVELVSPDGRPVVSKSAIDTNNLMYGRGYKLKETKSGGATKGADKASPKKANGGEEQA